MAVSNNPSQGLPTQGTTKEKAQDIADKARTTAGNVGEKVRDTASNLKERADDAISNVGQRMTSLADQLRENAPHEGTLGSAAGAVADNLRSGGRYLQEHGLEDMGADMTRLIRQYPVQSLLVAFGVGCLMGMTMSRR
jgi:ElaB/YqjD/DUF883 family membrane-anchored ribosome-binding protein